MMTPQEEVGSQQLEPRIGSFVVLDLETSNFPSHNFNKVGITELSMYGFAASELQKTTIYNDEEKDDLALLGEAANACAMLPATPRVLHKLTLLVNPRMLVHPKSEALTGLNNYLLEHESHFDENTANVVLGFIKRLRPPVCFVAHNGWNFDFPIVKDAFSKLNMALPSDTLCLDSIRAFLEIDQIRAATMATRIAASPTDQITATLEDALVENAQCDWRAKNETTPKRPTLNAALTCIKRSRLSEMFFELNAKNPEEPEIIDKPTTSTSTRTPPTTPPSSRRSFKSRRRLFAEHGSGSKCRKFPPKNAYQLCRMFERVFGRPPTTSHHAEDDVANLTKLMQHYGADFMAYAEEHAIPFAEIPRLGSNINY